MIFPKINVLQFILHSFYILTTFRKSFASNCDFLILIFCHNWSADVVGSDQSEAGSGRAVGSGRVRRSSVDAAYSSDCEGNRGGAGGGQGGRREPQVFVLPPPASLVDHPQTPYPPYMGRPCSIPYPLSQPLSYSPQRIPCNSPHSTESRVGFRTDTHASNQEDSRTYEHTKRQQDLQSDYRTDGSSKHMQGDIRRDRQAAKETDKMAASSVSHVINAAFGSMTSSFSKRPRNSRDCTDVSPSGGRPGGFSTLPRQPLHGAPFRMTGACAPTGAANSLSPSSQINISHRDSYNHQRPSSEAVRGNAQVVNDCYGNADGCYGNTDRATLPLVGSGAGFSMSERKKRVHFESAGGAAPASCS